MDLNDGAGGAAGGEGGDGGQGGAADLIGGGDGGQGGGEGSQGGGEGGGDGGQGGADPDWYSQVSGDPGEDGEASLRDWLKASGVKDVGGLAKIARDNMKAARAGGIKVPGENATAEEISAYNKAIGVPDAPEGYKMPTVKDADGKELELSADKLSAIAASAHKHGIPAKALEGVLQDIADADAAALATAEGELARAAAKHAGTWGAEKDGKLAAIDAAAEALKLTKPEMLKMRAALGPERSLDLLAQIGLGISEDTLLKGGKPKFMGDPKSSQARIDAMKADPKIRDKIFVPGTAEHTEYNRHLEVVAAAADREPAE